MLVVSYILVIWWITDFKLRWTYLFGKSKAKEKIFGLIFCLFIIIGASFKLDTVLEFADAMIFIMAIPNLIGLYILAPDVKKDLTAYTDKLRVQTS